ncbi:FAD-binding protein [Aneurinibacillus sp. Ricciae_BoGa-3]|uniref:FAD-binding protein n=1 Tax=Aneurinibacillus sp. Ricciae_BoGa-3 TaxID=3022697 RepID=UPI0023417E5C|nr:FAD-binding protein [Aneurinibacillus sp. Ricciae_BoGa-3]WCK56416.1 FAD-binding protein [Aneurinibacillus sp. Ricciae_BoGa-3]
MEEIKIAKTIATDVLVVGGGGAAAKAALTASQNGATVRMAVKSSWLKSGSTATAFSELLAIAAAIGHGDERDEPEIHYQDTMDAGRGFIDPKLVRTLAEDAPERINDLIELGLDFDKQKNGKLVQGMSDFATYPRTCRVNGVTARHILNIIARELKTREVPIDEQMMVFQLVTDEYKRIVGAIALDTVSNEFVFYQTPSVILACGGAHFLYTYGVGTPDMTGDGYAMAYQLGIPLVNMEFVQIGPGLINPPVTLLSGPVWKTHPILSNEMGERFLENNLPAEIDVKDVYNHKAFPFTVSNHSFYLDTLIQREFEKNPSPHGGVWCEMAPGSEAIVEEKMPKTKRVLKSKGIDVHTDKFEIGLVAQCMNGGAQISTVDGETDVQGLFIAGETAGGLRGPDRPGGNSLAEGQIFGYRTGKAAADYAAAAGAVTASADLCQQELQRIHTWLRRSEKGTIIVKETINELRKNMYRNCLVIRDEKRLTELWNFLVETEQDLEQGKFAVSAQTIKESLDLRNMIITAKSIALSALERKESRSCHYREDFPHKNDSNWKRSIRIVKNENGMTSELYEWPAEQKIGSL